jgi:hypothetical protein
MTAVWRTVRTRSANDETAAKGPGTRVLWWPGNETAARDGRLEVQRLEANRIETCCLERSGDLACGSGRCVGGRAPGTRLGDVRDVSSAAQQAREFLQPERG